tara:strand:- start:4727 stop:5032 length:306 start_codon:yes stop_codon:yes gene_type:complete
MVKPGKKGIESFFHLALGRRCDSSKCAAMKGLVEGDDLMTRLSLVPGPRSAKTSGELDETVVGFGAGVAEKDSPLELEAFLYKAFCQLCLLVDLIEVAAVN